MGLSVFEERNEKDIGHGVSLHFSHSKFADQGIVRDFRERILKKFRFLSVALALPRMVKPFYTRKCVYGT